MDLAKRADICPLPPIVTSKQSEHTGPPVWMSAEVTLTVPPLPPIQSSLPFTQSPFTLVTAAAGLVVFSQINARHAAPTAGGVLTCRVHIHHPLFGILSISDSRSLIDRARSLAPCAQTLDHKKHFDRKQVAKAFECLMTALSIDQPANPRAYLLEKIVELRGTGLVYWDQLIEPSRRPERPIRPYAPSTHPLVFSCDLLHPHSIQRCRSSRGRAGRPSFRHSLRDHTMCRQHRCECH